MHRCWMLRSRFASCPVILLAFVLLGSLKESLGDTPDNTQSNRTVVIQPSTVFATQSISAVNSSYQITNTSSSSSTSVHPYKVVKAETVILESSTTRHLVHTNTSSSLDLHEVSSTILSHPTEISSSYSPIKSVLPRIQNSSSIISTNSTQRQSVSSYLLTEPTPFQALSSYYSSTPSTHAQESHSIKLQMSSSLLSKRSSPPGTSSSKSIHSTQSLDSKIVSSHSTTRPRNSSSYLSMQSNHSQIPTSHLSSQLIYPQTSSYYLLTQLTQHQMQSSTMSSHAIRPQNSSSIWSSNVNSSSNENVNQKTQKIFVAEIRIINLNFSSDLQNKSSPLFVTTAAAVTEEIDMIMNGQDHYLGSQVILFREGSVITKLEIYMSGKSSSDPNIVMDRLKSAVKLGHFSNLTVDPTYFVAWQKKNPPEREKLLSGQLAGLALLVFIFVVLLLVICLGKFADEPLFQERDLYSLEMSMRDLGPTNSTGNREDEWKFDPLFAWSKPNSCETTKL